MASPRYLETISVIEDLEIRCRKFEVSPEGFSRELVDTFFDYLSDEDPRDDVAALVDHCVDVTERICDIAFFADRVIPRRVESQLRWLLDQQLDSFGLTQTVSRLSSGLSEGSDLAEDELTSLCRSGYDTHQALFSPVDSEQEVLALAFEHSSVSALHAALHPDNPGRLASEDKSRGRAMLTAMDYLAHIAAHPTSVAGEQARQSLVDLCAYIETADQAALRLPVHLIGEEHRGYLLDFYLDQESEIEQTVDVLVSDRQLRTREILRSVLFQISDATRTRVGADPAS